MSDQPARARTHTRLRCTKVGADAITGRFSVRRVSENIKRSSSSPALSSLLVPIRGTIYQVARLQ